MFISCWLWRVLHWCACLLFLPLAPSVCLPLSPSITHSARHPVAVSLFISPTVTNLHHLPVSNFPFSPPFRYLLAVALCLLLFFILHPHSPSLWRSPLFLSPSVSVLCLAYFRHHPPPSCFLLCVCCLFRLALLRSQRINPYTCQRVVEATLQLLFRPSGGTANLHIHECTHPHKHAFPRIWHVTGSAILNYFIVCSIRCFYPVHEQIWMHFMACLKWCYDRYPNISLQRRPSSVGLPTSGFHCVSLVCQKIWLPAETERHL